MNSRTRRILLTTVIAAAVTVVVLLSFSMLRWNDFRRYARETGLSQREAVKLYGNPKEETEWIMSLANAAYDEDWDRLDKLTRTDRHSELGSYYRNLAKAMKGELSDSLMHYYAPFERALFIPVGENSARFNIAQSGEVWYQLGEMTMAEHSAILGLIFSKKQNGPRFLQRLGEINTVWGDDAAAGKYFRITGRQSALSKERLEHFRSLLPVQDTIHYASSYRATLKSLVAANKDNRPAYEYLLCLDLLTKDIGAFVEDYDHTMPVSRLYQEAALIWMASTGNHSAETASYFRIGESVFNEFMQFNQMMGKVDFDRLQARFGHSYWFYFQYARRNEKN